MKKMFTKELTIGLSVVIAILILIFGIDYLKGINLFKPANFYVAYYDQVDGLAVSAPVSIQGFKVGQVREIKFNYEHPGKIEVVMALDKNLRVPEGTKAVLTPTLMSGPNVDLILGSGSKMLPVGGTVEAGRASDLMSSLSTDVMPQITTLLPKLDSILYNINMLVADPALANSIKRLDQITASAASLTQGLDRSVGGQLPAIMGNARRITATLDTVTGNLGALSYQLKTLPLQTTVDNVNELTENLSKFSARLNDPNSTLGMMTNDPELYNRLNRVAADVDSLIVDIKKNPKRYISIKLL